MTILVIYSVSQEYGWISKYKNSFIWSREMTKTYMHMDFFCLKNQSWFYSFLIFRSYIFIQENSTCVDLRFKFLRKSYDLKIDNPGPQWGLYFVQHRFNFAMLRSKQNYGSIHLSKGPSIYYVSIFWDPPIHHVRINTVLHVSKNGHFY